MDISHLKNKKVLYVEDDQKVFTSFSNILNKVFGEVISAVNGQDGLDLFYKNKDEISFVIADIKMPKMDGLKLCEVIKKEAPHIPLIITTAHAEKDFMQKAKEIGIYKYAIKPLNVSDLIATLSDY